MQRVRRTFPICIVLALALAWIAPPVASAGSPTPVEPSWNRKIDSIHAFGDIEVTRTRIFISAGRSGSTVAVLDRNGREVGSLGDVPGASGLEVVEGVLYVAAYGASRIERFDLSSDPSARLSPLSTAPLPSPNDLAFVGERLWFTSGCDQWGTRIGWMPLDGDPVRELESDGVPAWSYCTAIEDGVARSDRLWLHTVGSEPADLYQFAVWKGRTPELVNSTEGLWQWGSYNGSPAVPISRGTFVTGYDDGISAFQTRDLFGPTFSYNSRGRTHALAVTRRHGGRLAGATEYGAATKVRVWGLEAADATVTVKFGDSDRTGRMYRDGLAFSRRGSRLYVVTGRTNPRVWISMIEMS